MDGLGFVDNANALKREKLLDLVRRVIANPQNAREVAEQIALDWFPTIRVRLDGTSEIVVGDGKKR